MIKRSFVLLSLLITQAFVYGQLVNNQTAIDTRNITPFSTQGLKFQRFALSKSGNLYLQAAAIDGTVRFWHRLDSIWRDITQTNPNYIACYDMAASINNDLLFVTGKGKDNNNLITFWNYKWDWNRINSNNLQGDATGIALNKDEEAIVTGKFRNGPGDYYAAQYYKGDWKHLIQKSISDDIKNMLDTYDFGKTIVDQKGNIYLYLSQPKDNKHVIVVWSGKEWKMAGDPLPGALYDMVIDKTGKQVYVCGNFKNSDNSYYIKKWDGKQWSDLPVPPDTKFNADLNRSLTFTADNQLLTAGRHKKGKENIILKWDGAEWTQYGAVPGFVSSIVYDNDKAFSIVEGKDAGVYMVPNGGKVTETTLAAVTEPKDQKALEVLNLYYTFGNEYKVARDRIDSLTLVWQKKTTRTYQVNAAKDVEMEAIKMLIICRTYAAKFTTLGIMPSDNKLLESLAIGNKAQITLWENLRQMMKDFQNQFIDKNQFDYWWKSYQEDRIKVDSQFNKIYNGIPAYLKKNSLQ